MWLLKRSECKPSFGQIVFHVLLSSTEIKINIIISDFCFYMFYITDFVLFKTSFYIFIIVIFADFRKSETPLFFDVPVRKLDFTTS